jgi:hypothetical protein
MQWHICKHRFCAENFFFFETQYRVRRSPESTNVLFAGNQSANVTVMLCPLHIQSVVYSCHGVQLAFFLQGNLMAHAKGKREPRAKIFYGVTATVRACGYASRFDRVSCWFLIAFATDCCLISIAQPSHETAGALAEVTSVPATLLVSWAMWRWASKAEQSHRRW